MKKTLITLLTILACCSLYSQDTTHINIDPVPIDSVDSDSVGVGKFRFLQTTFNPGHPYGFIKMKTDTIPVYILVSYAPIENYGTGVFVIEGYNYSIDYVSYYLDSNKKPLSPNLIVWMSGDRKFLLRTNKQP